MSAVTGTFTDATSPRWRARATTAHNTMVDPTAMKPKSKSVTVSKATPAPIAVPTIWPNPSRRDL